MPSGRLVALLGSPRSGTTWLQRLLASDARALGPYLELRYESLRGATAVGERFVERD